MAVRERVRATLGVVTLQWIWERTSGGERDGAQHARGCIGRLMVDSLAQPELGSLSSWEESHFPVGIL